MRRTASEVIRSLEMRVARIERQTITRKASSDPTKTFRAPLLIEIDYLKDSVEIYAPKSEVRNITKIAEGWNIASVSNNSIGSGANPLYAIKCVCGGGLDDFIDALDGAGYTLIQSA
jgi:hypothetical protein